MRKPHITPLKNVTVPRLELTAALVSTKVSSVLRQELDYKNVKEVLWTDSQVVLGYIRNDARRFHVFVAILCALLQSSGQQLDDESLWTLCARQRR